MSKILLPLSASLLLFAACGDKAPASGAPAPTGNAAMQGDDHHGEKRVLGTLKVGEYDFEVALFGTVEADHEAPIEVSVPAGKPLPETARAWIGVESAKGSMRAQLTKENARTLHAHIEVPKTLMETFRLWIEVEAGGQKQRASIAW